MRAHAVDSRVLDRDAGAHRDLLRELQLGRPEHAGRHVGPEGHGPDRPVAGHQRHDDRRPQPGGAEPLERRLVARPPAQQRVVDVAIEPRAAVAEDAGGAVVAGEVELLPHGVDEVAAPWAGGDRAALEAPPIVGDVDAAPVGELRGDRGGGALERRVDVSDDDEDLAGGGEEALVVLGPARVGHVLHDVHRHDDRALGVADGGRLDEHPAVVARGLADAAHEHRLGRAAGQRLASGQPAEVHRTALLVERDEAFEDLRHRRREDLVGRRALRAAGRPPG